MGAEKIVYEVGPGEFEQKVLQASESVTVVVDFWAPWCGPCRMLTPALERVVRSMDGRARLAKVNVDQQPDLAAQLGVQSIPNVRIFRNRQIVGGFVGALPEPEVRRILERFVPSEADDLVSRGDALLSERKLDEARRLYEQALQQDPHHGGALLRLGTIAFETGQFDRARALFERVQENSPEYDTARGMLALIEFARTCQQAGGAEACRSRLEADPDDLDARYALACCLAARKDYEQALDQFLEVLKRDRNYRDGAARDAMVHIFSIVGQRSELADAYRRKLASVLY